MEVVTMKKARKLAPDERTEVDQLREKVKRLEGDLSELRRNSAAGGEAYVQLIAQMQAGIPGPPQPRQLCGHRTKIDSPHYSGCRSIFDFIKLNDPKDLLANDMLLPEAKDQFDRAVCKAWNTGWSIHLEIENHQFREIEWPRWY
jgi:hypothetical protein